MSTRDEDNARQSVVELLNDAAMAMDPNEKLESLTKVKELIIHKVYIHTNKLTWKLLIRVFETNALNKLINFSESRASR